MSREIFELLIFFIIKEIGDNPEKRRFGIRRRFPDISYRLCLLCFFSA